MHHAQSKKKTMIKNIFILCLLSLMVSCTETSNTNSTIDKSSAEWAIESNIKIDFTNPNSEIKVLKPSQKQMMDYILDAVETGAIKAYNYDTEELLNTKEIKQIFTPIDSVIVYNPDTGYEMGEKAVQNKLNRPAVNKFRVKQEWYWDEQTHQLSSKVTGLAPMETIYNEDGKTVRGDLALFWVFF